MIFACFKPEFSYNVKMTGEPECLSGKDITELSEYAHDRFIVGLWSENDFLTIDRS